MEIPKEYYEKKLIDLGVTEFNIQYIDKRFLMFSPKNIYIYRGVKSIYKLQKLTATTYTFISLSNTNNDVALDENSLEKILNLAGDRLFVFSEFKEFTNWLNTETEIDVSIYEKFYPKIDPTSNKKPFILSTTSKNCSKFFIDLWNESFKTK